MKNPEIVAIYALAIQFVNIFMSLSIAINSVFLARVTHIVNGENYLKRLNELFIRVSKYQTFILGLFLSGFILIGEIFIDLWVGEVYKSAYIIVIILMSAFSLDLIQNLGLVIMQAKGKYSFRACTLLICALLNVLISIPVIKVYDSIGTAIVTSIFVFIGNVLVLNVYYHKVLKLNMISYWRQIGKLITIITFIATVSFVIRSLFSIDNWLTLFIFGSFYSILYCFIIYILYLSKNEKLHLKNKFWGEK